MVEECFLIIAAILYYNNILTANYGFMGYESIGKNPSRV
jgi:hypothetical protein